MSEQISREPFLAGGMGGNKGKIDGETEKTEMQATLGDLQARLDKLMSELQQKKLQVGHLESDLADVQQNTQLLIQAAEKKAKKDAMASVQDQLSKVNELKEQVSSFDAQFTRHSPNTSLIRLRTLG